MKRSITLAIVAGALLVAGSALAQESKAQQKCINTLNKSMAKVAGAQNKANAKCVKTRAKDGTTDAQMCASTDAKVDKIAGITLTKETKACTEAPDFGSTSGGTVNFRSEFEALNLGDDLFNASIGWDGVALCTDKAACKCQGKAFKAATKLYKAYLKNYNKCKKLGLKNKATPFDAAEDLHACIGDDTKQKIAKAVTKLGGAITKKCASVPNAFPGGDCDLLTGDALKDCINERVRCRVCMTETRSDNLLTFDCDLFDDGDNEINSCNDET
jgi:hypothetical protein